MRSIIIDANVVIVVSDVIIIEIVHSESISSGIFN